MSEETLAPWEQVRDEVKAVSGVEGKKKPTEAVQKKLAVLTPYERACFLVVVCEHGSKSALKAGKQTPFENSKAGQPFTQSEIETLVARAKEKLGV